MLNYTEFAAGVLMLFNDPFNFVMILAGLIVGLVAGAMPGVSNTMAMAICLPMTLYLDFMPAVMFLTSIFTGSGFGGAIPAILMGLPGTPPAVATTFDGYPMARKGLHNEALGVGLASSCLGVIFSYVFLLLLVVPLANWVMRLGPAEMLMIAIWGLTMIASLGGKHMVRGLIAGAFGLLLGTVGMNTSGYLRDFGVDFLLDGIPVVPAMMGLLAASQLFTMVGTKFLVTDERLRKASYGRVMSGMVLVLRAKKALLRGSLIGAFIGAVPGVGGSIANLVSYAMQKRSDPDAASYGEGNSKGLIAAESANSSSEGGSMVTMLALGIPGGGGTAMLLAAFLMHNVTCGPQFISNSMNLVYMIVVGNLLQAILLIFVGMAFLAIAGNIVKVSLTVLIPSVLVLALFGSFSVTGDWSGPLTLFVCAALGWIMKRYDYPVAATVVGLILGRMVESELIRTWQISAGEIAFLFERPVALVFLVLLVLSLLQPVISRRLFKRRNSAAKPIASAD
jgi:putative tricarboxylic transport membrane protein